MQIRLAVINDLDNIEILWKEMAVFHQNIDPYFTLCAEADENHRIYMRGLIQDLNKHVFVADQAGLLLGYLVAEVKDYPPVYIHKNHGYISAIIVTSCARRTGVGRKLLNAALEWFRDQGLRRVECAVAVKNLVSQRFWKNMGFCGFMEEYMLDL